MRAAEPWGEPLAAARGAAAALEARRARQGGAGARLGRARVRVRRRRERRGDRPCRADRVPPSDRASDDRGQRAGRGAARVASRADAVPGPRTARGDGGPAADRAARLAWRANAAGSARRDDATAGGGPRRRGLATGQRVGGADRARPAGADEPRAADPEAGLLRPSQPRPRRPAVAALLPLHLADPPVSRPDLSPGAAVGGHGRFGPRPSRRGWRRRARGARRGSGTAMSIERGADDIARCFFLERMLFEAGRRPACSTARSSA